MGVRKSPVPPASRIEACSARISGIAKVTAVRLTEGTPVISPQRHSAAEPAKGSGRPTLHKAPSKRISPMALSVPPRLLKPLPHRTMASNAYLPPRDERRRRSEKASGPKLPAASSLAGNTM